MRTTERIRRLRGMVRWATRRYSLGRVTLKVHPGLLYERNVQGDITWLDNGITLAKPTFEPPFIVIVSSKPFRDTVENSLLHELAHCLTVKRHHYCGHGRRWTKNLAMITADWNAHLGLVQ